jgi:hypothetical protein
MIPACVAGDTIVGEIDARRRGRRRLHRLGQTEVEHLHLAARRELDVGRLEIAMDDAFLVRRLERVGDLRAIDRPLRLEPALRDPVRSVGPSTSSRTMPLADAASSKP